MNSHRHSELKQGALASLLLEWRSPFDPALQACTVKVKWRQSPHSEMGTVTAAGPTRLHSRSAPPAVIFGEVGAVLPDDRAALRLEALHHRALLGRRLGDELQQLLTPAAKSRPVMPLQPSHVQSCPFIPPQHTYSQLPRLLKSMTIAMICLKASLAV